MNALEELKGLIRDQLGLPPAVILIMAGAACHLALNVLLRKPLTCHWGLLAAVGLGILLESYEIWVQYRDIGLFAPENDSALTILMRHSRDVMLVAAVPALLVLARALKK